MQCVLPPKETHLKLQLLLKGFYFPCGYFCLIWQEYIGYISIAGYDDNFIQSSFVQITELSKYGKSIIQNTSRNYRNCWGKQMNKQSICFLRFSTVVVSS